MAEDTKKSLYSEFVKGLWQENPIFRMLLGMCPTLAVTNSAINGLAMGLATAFVLTCSSIMVSLIRKIVPGQVRLASFIVIIATFVTIADYFLKAFFPPISKQLGPYVPLIVVNCVILGRAEAFSSKNPMSLSVADASGIGIGFTWALVFLGIVREILGFGSIFNIQIFGEWFEPWIVMVLPAGAFITLGIMIGVINIFTINQSGRGVCFGCSIGYRLKEKLVTAESMYLTPEELEAAKAGPEKEKKRRKGN
ncbi:MAG: electron transport complex subunit RsxE [Nitrospinota bacterium]